MLALLVRGQVAFKGFAIADGSCLELRIEHCLYSQARGLGVRSLVLSEYVSRLAYKLWRFVCPDVKARNDVFEDHSAIIPDHI